MNYNNNTNNSSEDTQSIHNLTGQQIKDISFGSLYPQSEIRFHNDVAKLISEESSILDIDEDENIKKRRQFELNLNKKRNCIRREFHREEDQRQSNQKTSAQTNNENKFKEVLNEWIKKNDEKLKNLDRDKEVYNKISLKENTLNSTQNDSNMKFKKINTTTTTIKPKNEFSSVFPVANNASQGQEYFPLKNEKNPEELNARVEALKMEGAQTELSQEGENQRYKSLMQIHSNLVKHLDQRKKEIREEETLVEDMQKKQNTFEMNQLEMLKNLFSTKRDVQQLQEIVDKVEEKSNNVIGKKLTEQTQEQKEIKHEENKLSSVLLKIDQAETLHQQTLQELIQVQKEEEYRKNKKNESYKLIFSLKDMKYLDDLCLKNKIDEYIDKNQLEFYTTKKHEAINFETFELEYPLINFRRSLPNIEKSKLQDVIDSFYKDYPSGPYKLSESLIEQYRGYIQKFESLKRYYQDMCLQVQTKRGEFALLTTELNEYIEIEQNWKMQEIKDKNVIQLLEGFEDLKGSIDTFKEYKKISRNFKEEISFSLAIFMKLLDNTLRLTNIITLISTSIYPELPLGLTSKSDEVQTIIKEKFNKKNIKILRKQKTKYSTKIENLDVNGARLSRLSILSPQKIQVQTSPSRPNSQQKNKRMEQDQSYEFKSYYNDDKQIKIVPNDFDSLFVELITSNLIPAELKDKWARHIVRDPLIYGFCSCQDIELQIKEITSQRQDQSKDKQTNLNDYQLLLQNIIKNLSTISLEQLSSLFHQILDLNGLIIKDILVEYNAKKQSDWNLKKFKNKKVSQMNQNKLIKEIQTQVSTKIDQTLVNPIDSPQAKIRISDDDKEGDKKKKNNQQFKVEDFIEYLKKDRFQSKKQIHEVDEKFKNEDIVKRRKSSALFKENYEEYYLQKESKHYDEVTTVIKKKYNELEEQNEEEKYREEMKFFLQEKEKKEQAKQRNTLHYQESNKSNRYGTHVKDLLENSHAMAFINRQEQLRKKQDLSRTHINLKKQDYLLERKYENNPKSSRVSTTTHLLDKSESRGDSTFNRDDSRHQTALTTNLPLPKSHSQEIRKVNIKDKKQTGKNEEQTPKEQPQGSSSTQFPRLQNNNNGNANGSYQNSQQQTIEPGDENNANVVASKERQKKIQQIENAYKRVRRAKSTNQLPTSSTSQTQQNGQIDKKPSDNNNDGKQLLQKQLEDRQANHHNNQDNAVNQKMLKITQSYVNIKPNKLNIPALKLMELIKEKRQQTNTSINQSSKPNTQQSDYSDSKVLKTEPEERSKQQPEWNSDTNSKNGKEKIYQDSFYKQLPEIKEVNSTTSKPFLTSESLMDQLHQKEKTNINKKFADIYKQKLVIKSPVPFTKIRSVSTTAQ